jgi:hypothetical protein
MKNFPHCLITKTDVERCLSIVNVCDSVMTCPCCCYFLDKRNSVVIEGITNEIDKLPKELTIIKIPLLPTPETIHYYSFNSIETIIYNLFRTVNKKQKQHLESGDAFLKVYYEKDPLFTIPQIVIEVIFFNKLKEKTVDELRNTLKSEIILFTGAVGDIFNISVDNAEDLTNALHVPLLIGVEEFELEGALKKHNFSSEQIMDMNYLHSVSVTYLKMSEIINNNKLTLFDEQREAIQKEKEDKLRNDKDVIEAIDAIFGKRNGEEEEEELDDLPF